VNVAVKLVYERHPDRWESGAPLLKSRLEVSNPTKKSSGMNTEEFRHLHALEKRFWWFAGMREIASALLDPFCPSDGSWTVLDAGCGTGANLIWLRRYAAGGRIVGIDLAADALQFCQTSGESLIARASVTSLPFIDSAFDLVTSFDVLVQLPDNAADRQAAREMYRVLRPGGIAFVRVAAYEAMRSSHDEELGTCRRYTLEELTAELKYAGFGILRATYANTLLLPLAMIWRLGLKRIGLAPRGSDVRPLPSTLRWANGLLETALKGEAHWLRRKGATLPAGLSAICVARKPHVQQ
jgi:SAM-dependent methyltransferase